MTKALFILLLTFVNTFGILDILLILKLFFKCEINFNKRTMPAAVGIFVVFNAASYLLFWNQDEAATILIYVYVVLSALILTKKHRLRAVVMTIPAVLVYSYSSVICEIFEKMIGWNQYKTIYNQKITPLSCLSDFILFFILMILWKYSRETSISLHLTFWEGMVLVFLSAVTPGLSSRLDTNPDNRLYTVIWTVFLLLINIIAIYAIAHRKKAAYYQHLSENYKNQFAQEYDYFQNYKEAQADTIKFRHDWKNHMLLLQGMLENGDYEKAKTYFNELSGKTSFCKQNVLTGDEIVDMLLASKMHLLEQKHIELICEGRLKRPSVMENVDSCILFSNLIDNAIEANEVLEKERYIRITARKSNQLLYVEISNPVKQMVQVREKGIPTTKPVRNEHGIGLKNVREIIEKYQGEYHILATEQEFSIQIVLPDE